MTPGGALDLDAYLARIGFHGARTKTFETLAAILGAHMAAIPFENLDVLLGRPDVLATAAEVERLVHGIGVRVVLVEDPQVQLIRPPTLVRARPDGRLLTRHGALASALFRHVRSPDGESMLPRAGV